MVTKILLRNAHLITTFSRELLNESSTASKRIKVLEQDLRLTLETVEQLQQEKKNSSKFERQRDALRKELVQLQQSSSDEKAHIEKGSAADWWEYSSQMRWTN